MIQHALLVSKCIQQTEQYTKNSETVDFGNFKYMFSTCSLLLLKYHNARAFGHKHISLPNIHKPTLREERRRESRGRGQERWARVANGGWGEREDIWNSLGRRGEREITL